MLKVKVRWSGFIGSPGWSNFFFDTGTEDFYTEAQAIAAADRVTTFLNAVKTKLPPAVSLLVQSDIEAVSPSTGELQNVLSAGARTAINGSATAQPYSAATGAVITWRTAGVRNGRRVRGRTFLVPCVSGMFENDGTIQAGNLTEISTAASALAADVGGIRLGIWSRPSAPGAADGDWYPVTAVSVPDMGAVLRSRRG
jgi:hypothetical protein